MSRSYKGVPQQWGPRPRKPQHEPTIEEELEEMNPQEIYVVMSEDQPRGTETVIEEAVAHHRSRQAAWNTLAMVADGYGLMLSPHDTSFEVTTDASYEYRCWYITSAILED